MKTLILGLDGGTFEIIDPLIKQNKLPNLSYLIKNGCHGILKSTIHPITAPAWTSFMTGVNPGKHGIYDFSIKLPRSYEIKYALLQLELDKRAI